MSGQEWWYSLLAGVALKSAGALGAAGLAAWLLRGRSAAFRHVAWTAGFVALLALPLLTVALPAVRVPAPDALLAPSVTFGVTASADAWSHETEAAGRTETTTPPSPAPWRLDWGFAAVSLWGLGAAALIAQLLAGWSVIGRARRRAPAFADAELPDLKRALGINGVETLETPPGRMPFSFGLLRPAVFMPADAAEWSRERRRMVLLHELAHIRRGDHATHLLARLALALYWWNPLAWVAWREFLKERERAADDLVLESGARASDYAGHLLEVARAMRCSTSIGWAAVAVARRSQLEGRLLAILDPRRNRKSPGRAFGLAVAAITVAALAPLAALQAQDPEAALPADIDATIRAALAAKNHEILDKAAKAAEALRQFDVAQKLLETSLAIRGQVSGEQSPQYGVGLAQLGDLARKRSAADAETLYQRAVALLGTRPEAASPLISLGISALIGKNYDQAFDYFQRAQNADPAKAGEAAMWTAIVRERQGRSDEAEQLYQIAVGLAAPNSAQKATVLEVYALALRHRKRGAEAGALEQQALAIRKELDARTAGPFETLVSSGVVSDGRRSTASPTPAGVYRVGAGVTPPRLRSKVEPIYSEEARAAGYQGTVILYVEVGPDGKATNIRVQRSLGLALDERAIDAVRQWVFEPGMREGQPVTVAATIEVNFRLL